MGVPDPPVHRGGRRLAGRPGTTDLDRITVAIGTPNPNYFCPSRRPPQAVAFSHPGYLGGLTAPRALSDYAGSNLNGTGVLRRYTPGRIADVTDGTSNTLLVAREADEPERPRPAEFGGQPGVHGRVGRGHAPADGQDPHAGLHRDHDPQRLAPVRPSHPGRFNAAFADGSVRSVPYTIDKTVWEHVGDRADGQVIPLNDL